MAALLQTRHEGERPRIDLSPLRAGSEVAAAGSLPASIPVQYFGECENLSGSAEDGEDQGEVS